MMNRSDLDLCAQRIVDATANWTEEERERLEACREMCRTVCCQLGLSQDTAKLGDLWTMLTKVGCLRTGCPGYDIHVSGMGRLPMVLCEMKELKKINPYHMVAFQRELQIAKKLLPELRSVDPHFFSAVEDLLDNVIEMVS